MIEIYTDGGYNPALEQGGWGAVIITNGQKDAFSGTVQKTTSNRMEITAALEGIARTPPASEVTIYTDSQYLFGCMTKKWRKQKNLDLLEKLEETARQRQVRWKWISGDSDNPYHKEAHNLAEKMSGMTEKRATRTESPVESTHIDEESRIRTANITGKPDTLREAVAKGRVKMKPGTLALIKEGRITKGDVLTVSELAGIMAARQTAHLIPLCHIVLTDEVKVEFNLNEQNSTVEITSTVKSSGKAGVEMEALTAVSIAALTIYDMCKAVEPGITIENIRLV